MNGNRAEEKKTERKKAKLFSWRFFLYDLIRVTAVPGLLFFRPKAFYENEEARKKIRGGALLISNHVGFFDPVHLMFAIWYRRHHFICMKEFFEEGKLKRFIFQSFLCIPIDRENFNMSTFREITEHLKQGELVTMFPAGHIGFEENDLSGFKSGMVMMALSGDCPIIPVYLHKKEHRFSRLKFAVGSPVDVRKLYMEKPSLTRVEEIAKILEEKEAALSALIR